MQGQQLLAVCAPGSQMDAGGKVLFSRIWTHDDDGLAPLGSLMQGLLRCLLFKPPFGSHGAVRLRSVP